MQRHIKAWVPVGAPWNGAVNCLSGLSSATASVSDENTDLGVATFTCPKCKPRMDHAERGVMKSTMLKMLGPAERKINAMLTELLRTLPSVYWLSTGVDRSQNPPHDKVYVEMITEAGKKKTYRASQVPQHLADDLHDKRAGDMMQYALSVGTTTDPGVPVHCVFGYNVRTDNKIIADFTQNADSKYTIELGDGDGTVHTEGSLDVCTRWKSTVKTYKLPGVIHNAAFNVRQVADIILAVATDDEKSWKAWKEPKYTELVWMERNDKTSPSKVDTEALVDVSIGS